ncbi:hypothetical protein KIH77_10110 [Bifidobacterium sp. 82T24]|uniref:hypothetical protein n=1 Tax=Bifidobacterium pluvialisilvae TaxID=2834436 RepID=UPI001C560ADC|nr:hypothetical protein [Bifidobacterium pluvialisilvae]MBW3089065.1 hypothetical protein [Bifidobacterium pluvialisilvae]
MTLTPTHRYDDIIELPHHVSYTRPRMSAHNRAAQFMPFAALNGYDAIIMETARQTQRRVELDVDARQSLDERLRRIAGHEQDHPRIAVTFFMPDPRKDGGVYVTVTDELRRIDQAHRLLRLGNGQTVPLGDIIDIRETADADGADGNAAGDDTAGGDVAGGDVADGMMHDARPMITRDRQRL